MIDSVVKLAEKIAEWAKYRNERSHVRFKRLIEPTFEAMKAVHADYLSFLEECLQALRAGDSISSVADTLERRRLEQESERRAIEHQAEIIREDKDFSEFHDFFYDVEHYLHLSPFANGTASSILRHVLHAAINAESSVAHSSAQRANKAGRDAVIKQFESALTHLRHHWADVARAYAECLKKAVP